MKERLQQIMEYEFVRKLMFAIKFFTTKRVITAASALTYSTILSLVPICAVVFAIARGFGFTIYIEQWFRNLLSSQSQAAELIIGFVNSYLEHAKSGIILGIGLVFMLYTVVMLTRNVEQTFNDIWHVENRKNILRTFTDYLSIFFLVPILIIIMSGLSLFLTTMVKESQWDELLGPVMQFVVDIIPFLLMWLAFTALYVLMPNTKVKVIHAVLPGFIAAFAMTCLQWFYIHAQMWVSNYNAIYGSFAALPLFMLWIQFSWTICLFGAELTYTNQNLEDFTFADGATSMSHRYKLMLSIILLSRICKRFMEGKHPYTATGLKDETEIPVSVVRDLLRNLVKVNMLTPIVGEKISEEVRFQPATALDNITVGSVVDRLEAEGVWETSIDMKSLVKNKEVLHKILETRKQYINELESYTLKDL